MKSEGLDYPTLSVVMPNYNHERLIRIALDAILNQSCPPLEILVVDDASTDGSRTVVQELASRHSSIKLLVNDKNRGVNFSVNRGLSQCRGEYVYFPGSDDRILPGFFENAMMLASLYPQAGIVFGKLRMTDHEGRVVEDFGVRAWTESMFASPKVFLNEYLEKELPTHSLCGATIYKKNALLEVGGYQQELGHWGDTFSARAIGLSHGACYWPEVAMVWRVSPQGYARSHDKKKKLAIVQKAAALMRSERYRNLFPENHVRRWEQGYREMIQKEFAGHPGRLRWLHFFGKKILSGVKKLMPQVSRN